MSPIRNKRQRGRRRLTREEIEKRESLVRDDGRRLNDALQALGPMSQAEAARLSGIPQGRLNDIVNGNRAIGRDELRRLAKTVGVPADYVLGIVTEFVPVGQIRTPRQLEADVANHVAREVERKTRRPMERASATWHAYLEGWRYDGREILRLAVDRAVEHEREAFDGWDDLTAFVEQRLRAGDAYSVTGIPRGVPIKGESSADRKKRDANYRASIKLRIQQLVRQVLLIEAERRLSRPRSGLVKTVPDGRNP